MTTSVRGLRLAIHRAIDLVHVYRAENCIRGDEWRADPRHIACMAEVRRCRASIREFHNPPRPTAIAWCIACRGSRLADNECDGCGAPVDMGTLNEDALECVGILVHNGCDTGHVFFERNPAVRHGENHFASAEFRSWR